MKNSFIPRFKAPSVFNYLISFDNSLKYLETLYSNDLCVRVSLW